MALVANDPKAAKRLGIPQKVGKEFMKADKGRKFGDGEMKKYAMGGRMMRPEREPLAERMRVRRGDGPVRARPLPEFEPMYKKGGSVKESKEMMKKEVSFMKKKGAPKSMIRHEEKEAGMKKMRSGGMTGSYRKAADGIASKGKTKGKMVKMAYGGKC